MRTRAQRRHDRQVDVHLRAAWNAVVNGLLLIAIVFAFIVGVKACVPDRPSTKTEIAPAKVWAK